jgi:hypothetical protein
MSFTSQTTESAALERYNLLRRLFVLGYAMNIVLWFVPTYQGRLGGFVSGSSAEDSVYSTFLLVRILSQTSPGWTLFFVVSFALNIVFIVLAFSWPKRWLFLTASSVSAFFVLWGLFSSGNPNLHSFLLPLLLGYIASAMTMVGFFIKPPVQT